MQTQEHQFLAQKSAVRLQRTKKWFKHNSSPKSDDIKNVIEFTSNDNVIGSREPITLSAFCLTYTSLHVCLIGLISVIWGFKPDCADRQDLVSPNIFWNSVVEWKKLLKSKCGISLRQWPVIVSNMIILLDSNSDWWRLKRQRTIICRSSISPRPCKWLSISVCLRPIAQRLSILKPRESSTCRKEMERRVLNLVCHQFLLIRPSRVSDDVCPAHTVALNKTERYVRLLHSKSYWCNCYWAFWVVYH
jgi:hypothetical protein